MKMNEQNNKKDPEKKSKPNRFVWDMKDVKFQEPAKEKTRGKPQR
jgi:hypothetical protein